MFKSKAQAVSYLVQADIRRWFRKAECVFVIMGTFWCFFPFASVKFRFCHGFRSA